MPPIITHTDPRHPVEEFSPETAITTRSSRRRATRIREFVCAHLPDHVDVEVVITPHVATAAVLPADIDAILGADATEVDREQATLLLDGVDADYLVLVTGNVAPLDRIPLNDQLTADHAHQFGLAFHELLHILKTAIITIGQLIDEAIDQQYHEQVHDLINIIEDGAIESEAIHGENFSNNAGIRLELTRRIHSQTPEDIPDGQHVNYSFWDAVTSTLYDAAIYPTGITDTLLDPDDDRIVFKSDADRQAFEAVHDGLKELAEDALAIKSADPEDTTHSHDKHASVLRAKRVIETWKTVIQPVLENRQTQDHEQPSDNQQGTDSRTGQQEQDGDESNQPQSGPSTSGQKADTESGDGEGSENDDDDRNETDESVTAAPEADPASLPDGFDPSNVSVDREATDDPYQDVFEHPQITPDPDPEDIRDQEDAQTGTADAGEEDTPETENSAGGDLSDPNADSSVENGPDPGDATNGEAAPRDDSPPDQEPQSRAQALAQAAERAREKDPLQGSDDIGQEPAEGRQTVDSTNDADQYDLPSSTTSSRDQLSLGDFESDSSDATAASDPGSDIETEDESDRGTDDESDPSEGGHEPDQQGSVQRHEQSDRKSPETASDLNDLNGSDDVSSWASSSKDDESVKEADQEPNGPAHDRRSERSAEEEQDTYEDALAADRKAAHDEADRASIDRDALERELENLARVLDREQRQNEDGTYASGGTSGGPESLDDIELLPITDDLAPSREWAAIEEGANQVAGTLEKELRLERQRGERTGLTAGTYDTRAGHRLAIGDPRVCKTRTPGREKRYCLVLVLDRSGSMRNGSPPKIEMATQALARFAVATEALGIKIAIIDFIRGNARLVKPFSIETRHVQTTLLDTSCGGGTPLADAIGLARQLIESQRDEPLIITVTDDEPSSVEAVKEQIRESHAPVCSLTIATDCDPGDLSPDASELAAYYERQAAVYTPERLDDRLDQFASLLAGF